MHKILSALSLSLLFVGCTTKANLSYKPVIPAQEPKNISVKLESFTDQRKEKEAVGAIRNLYGMPIIKIKTDDDVPTWMSSALKAELTNAGYEVLDSARYIVEGRIKKVFSNAHFTYSGSLLVEIALKKDGTVLFERVYKTSNSGGMNWIASPAQCMNTLEKSLQTVCKQFINDLNEHLSAK